MKLLVSREWLLKKIIADPDIETDAGVVFALLEGAGVTVPSATSETEASGFPDDRAVRLRAAFGVMMRLLRNREGISVAELAARASISEDEVRGIEYDPHHTPRPRTLYQLASHFGVPVSQLSQMSGASRVVDRVLYNEAVKFAARSEDLSTLSDEELEALNAFVKVLVDRDAGQAK